MDSAESGKTAEPEKIECPRPVTQGHEKKLPGMKFPIGGETFYVRPLSPADTDEIIDEITKCRKTPLQRIASKLEGIPAHLQEVIALKALEMEPAFDDFVSDDELAQYVDTRKGFSLVFWMMVRQNHPEVTREKIDELMKKISDEEFEKVVQLRDELAAKAAAKADAENADSGNSDPEPEGETATVIES